MAANDPNKRYVLKVYSNHRYRSYAMIKVGQYLKKHVKRNAVDNTFAGFSQTSTPCILEARVYRTITDAKDEYKRKGIKDITVAIVEVTAQEGMSMAIVNRDKKD